jgi:hypothetical protein
MNQETDSLFDLKIDPASSQFLHDSARWGKFLSIVGFVLAGLLALLGILMGTVFTRLGNQAMGMRYLSGVGVMGFYILAAILYFFPCLFLFRFSTKIQDALRLNDQEALADAFSNLKAYFRFFGILTIIALGMYMLVILIFLMSAASMR